MQKKLSLLLFLILNSALFFAQTDDSFQLKAEYVSPNSQEDFQMQLFEGINKLKFSLGNNKDLVGKDYKITIREYQDGELKTENTVLDTQEENLPKIDSTFQFTLIAQNILNYEKIGFFFPRFMNKKTFKTNEIFNDGDFSLRQINVGEKFLNFQLKEPFQIALITPPNRDPSKGNLGYCEVSQGGIEIEKWYDKYKIPQFFLIYLEIG